MWLRLVEPKKEITPANWSYGRRTSQLSCCHGFRERSADRWRAPLPICRVTRRSQRATTAAQDAGSSLIERPKLRLLIDGSRRMRGQPCRRTGYTTPLLSRENFASIRYRSHIKFDGETVRREKRLVFSGCNSRPATGSLHPMASSGRGFDQIANYPTGDQVLSANACFIN